MKFFMGLYDSYSAAKSQLLFQSPLPSVGKVFFFTFTRKESEVFDKYSWHFY